MPRYTAIHGLKPLGEPAVHTVYDHCLPRLAEWLARESIPATFFAIGEDLEREKNRRSIAGLYRAGHEIANHSYRHHYDLTRRTNDEIAEEIERGAAIIEATCGERPAGFRAPGYAVCDALFDALEASGAQYDSSVFPCPSYYGLKAAALAVMKLRGRRSESVLDSLAVLRAPRDPYPVGRPYWRRGKGILELPIGVTRWQLPYIGTSLVVGGAAIAVRLTKQMVGRELINLELHGFDAADSVEDGLEALVRHRPDLRRPAEEKLGILTAAVRAMRENGYELVTLRDAAHRIKSRSSP